VSAVIERKLSHKSPNEKLAGKYSQTFYSPREVKTSIFEIDKSII
jgi:hypothetical protein